LHPANGTHVRDTRSHEVAGAAEPDTILTEARGARQRFLELVDNVRPELHRYCARMTGSIADGEDVVQDTLARAYFELAERTEIPPLRPWLFRVAHNRAIDFTRRYERRMGEPLDAAGNLASDPGLRPDSRLARDESVRSAFGRFLELAPAQRGSVVLKDVLGYSLEEIAAMLDLTVPAVKGVLHRGRERLRELAALDRDAATATPGPSPVVTRYAELFNRRDWEGVRALLVEDVKLDLVTRWKVTGREQVGTTYLGNYERASGWHFLPARLEGRDVIAVFGAADDLDRAAYFIELAVEEGRVAAIRDFRYVPYIAREAAIHLHV
jgi:RNA polymerase sigma-70 factor (ECF subfamily)